MSRFFLIITLSLAVLSCGPRNDTQLVTNGPAFNANAASYVHKKGPGRIDGEAFVLNGNGKPLYAAGETIRLVPATEYAKYRFVRLYRGGTFVPANAIPRISPDPQYAQYTRTTTASARGKFSFQDMAPGEYFITAQKVHKAKGSFTPLGGAMFAKVVVTGKEEKPIRVVLAGR